MEGERGLCCGVRGGWGRSALGEQESWTPEGMWGPLPVPPTLTSIAALGSAPRSFLCRPCSHWGPSSPSLGPVLPLTGAHPPHCHWGSVLPSLGPVLPAVTRGPSSLSLGPVLPITGGPSSPVTGARPPHHWGPSSPITGACPPHRWGPSSPVTGGPSSPSLGLVLPSLGARPPRHGGPILPVMGACPLSLMALILLCLPEPDCEHRAPLARVSCGPGSESVQE